MYTFHSLHIHTLDLHLIEENYTHMCSTEYIHVRYKRHYEHIHVHM